MPAESQTQIRNRLIEELKDTDGGAIEVMKKLLNHYIRSAHRVSEDTTGIEDIKIKGEIRGYRKLLGDLERERK
jgi:hypothetical protein